MALSLNTSAWRPDESTVPLVSTYDTSVSTTYQAVLENSLVFSPFSGGVWWSGVPFPTDVTISFRLWHALEENREYIYIFAEDDDPPFTDTYLVTNLSTDDDPYGSNPGHGITGRSHGWVTCTATIPANTSYIEIGYVRFDAFWVIQGFSIGPITLDGVADDLSPGTIWEDFSSVTIQDIDDSKTIALNTNIYSDINSSASNYRNFPLDIPFRIRDGIKSSGVTSDTAKVQYRLNGGAYADCTTSTPVQLTASTSFSDGDATSETAMTSSAGGTFVPGVARTSTNSVALSLTNTQRTEFEWCLKMDSAQVTVNDIVEIKVVTVIGALGLVDQVIVPTVGLGDNTYPPLDTAFGDWVWGAMPTQDTDDSDFDLGFNGGVAGSYNDRIYRLGAGELHSGDAHDGYPMVVAYDYTLDRWIDIGGRDLIDIYAGGIDMDQACVLGNKIYVVNATSRDDFDAHVGKLLLIYNIDTDHWTTGSDPPAIVNASATDWWRVDYGCAVGLDDKVYVFGGECKQNVPTLNTFRQVAEVHIYDTTNDTWSVGADMPTDADDDSNEFPNAVAKGHKIYVVTQYYNDPDAHWTRLSVYNVNTDSWEVFNPDDDGMDEAHTAEYGSPMLAPDGTIWIALHHPIDEDTPVGLGGVGVLIFDPDTETFSEGPNYPYYMSLGQWMDFTQRGFSQYLTPGAQTIFDGPTSRDNSEEVGNNMNSRSFGTIGTNLVFTLYDGSQTMVYTGFEVTEAVDVLSTIATLDHDLIIGVEEDQHHPRQHPLDANNGTHTSGLFYKSGTHEVPITDSDFTTPVDGMIAITYGTELGTGITHRVIWARANGVWRGIEA